MKKYILYITLFIGILTSCNVDRFPLDKVSDGDMNADQFDALLNGCYSTIKNWADVMHRVREYPADNIVIRGSSTDAFYSFISYQPIADNYRLSSLWNNSYKVIYQTSYFIDNTQEGKNSTINQQLGEAYYLRALCYFYMCNTWGRPYYQSPKTNLGVPIVNGFDISKQHIEDLPDRSSVYDVYQQVISDLEKACELMTVSKRPLYATKEAAQALLSRVYLYMGGTFENPDNTYNDLAIKYAELVIGSGRFQLLSYYDFQKYNTYAPANNAQTETIFAIGFKNSDYPGTYDYYYGIGGMYANIKGMGWGEMYASEKYLQLLKRSSRLSINKGGKTDARAAFIWPQYPVNSNGDTIKTPAIRFIVPEYNANGDTTNFVYKQFALDTDNSGALVQPYQFTEVIKDKDDKIIFKKTYQIQHVIDNDYTVINYINQSNKKEYTYTGEKDYMMTLNRAYPMFYVTKCSLQEGYPHLYSPTISRLAEMYLNIAEAYVKKGNYDLALPYLNHIRRRATNGTEYESLDASNAKQLVTLERQLEFGFEAHRTMDVFRNGETMERKYPGPHYPMKTYPATSKYVVQLIPQSEINAYPGKLTQNDVTE